LEDSPQALASRVHSYGRLILRKNQVITKELENHHSKEVDNSWINAGLDAVTDAFLLSRGCDEVSRADVQSSVDRAGGDKIAAAYNAIRYAAIKKGYVKGSMSNREVAVLKKAAEKFIEWGKSGFVPADRFIQQVSELQKMFGRHVKSPWEPNRRGALLSNFYEKFEDEMNINPMFILSEKFDVEDLSDEQLKKIIEAMKKKEGKVKQRGRWGDMSIESLKITVPNKYLRQARRPKPNFVGAFRYPHRALLPGGDGMAFGLIRRIKGGTILLDCSGSMNINQADIDRLLEMAPMATVACYEGLNQKPSGSLAVIVRKGWMVKREDIEQWRSTMRRVNVVDGPALEWLSKQEMPRIWISDGKVTGVGDQYFENLNLEAAILKMKGKIVQYQEINNYLRERGLMNKIDAATG